jgi:H+-transporting ATPase
MVAALSTIPAEGLTSAEAARLLAQQGPNAVTEEHETVVKRVSRHFWAPVPWMLEATVALQLALGEWIEAALIGALLIFNVALGVFQESRADAALALLKQRLTLTARVRRDGSWVDVPAANLVVGDIVRLSIGTVVPADLQLIDGSVLLDQSMLTGESVPAEAGEGKGAYAGAAVRRGEAVGRVIATGVSTFFGRAAELVRVARVESTEQKTVMGLVRNLSIVNAIIVVALVAYAQLIGLPSSQIILLVLTAMLSAVPVALPATFTLAAALGAKAVAMEGVLLTRLSALHEAATIDVLCADKTGTLTANELGVVTVRPLAEGWTADKLLAYTALASSNDGRDPVDAAIRRAASATPERHPVPEILSFTPFDPTRKLAEASVREPDGRVVRIVKGAPAAVAAVAPLNEWAQSELAVLTQAGHRVLAVADAEDGRIELLGFIALSDAPRPDSAALLTELRSLGVRTVMVTGDAVATAGTVAAAIGLDGKVCPPGKIPDSVTTEQFAIYAGVFPEDKFRLVRAFQRGGHAVGMCGDGANDAPALRQAQMGIAVSTATDVAKAAAGIVLTKPGLGGIVTAIKEGRTVFQRMLTYTLSILVNKWVTLVVLGIGLVMTGHAILTPMLQALAMFAGDFVSMARTADRASPSSHPNAWRLRNLTIAAVPLASCKLLFFVGVLATGTFRIGLNIAQMQTLTFIMLVFAGQGLVYVLRERGRLWSSRPSATMMLFSLADITFVATLALSGLFMQPLPARVVFGLMAATAMFILLLDQVKIIVLGYFQID